MSAVPAISDASVPWTGLRARAAAGRDGEADIETMLLGLEEDALAYKIALRVQEAGSSSQPLSRIDVTDLALMIVSGTHMKRVLDTVAQGLPPGYAEGW